jgi:hypothetical protein
MKFFMTGQEKVVILIQVATSAGLYIKLNSRILFGPVNSNFHFEDWVSRGFYNDSYTKDTS